MGFGEMEHIGNGGEGFRVREVRGSRVLGGFCSHVSISGSRSEVEEERIVLACFVLELNLEGYFRSFMSLPFVMYYVSLFLLL